MSTLLDTNVLSELLRPRPEPAVVAWLSSQPPDSVFVSAITQAEMFLGARILPAGMRRSALESALLGMFEQDFAGRVLPLDASVVAPYVDIVAARRSLGRPISQFDAQIAAIARRARMRLATRNTADFADCGIDVTNPWMDAAS